jgi:hypothetical protein
MPGRHRATAVRGKRPRFEWIIFESAPTAIASGAIAKLDLFSQQLQITRHDCTIERMIGRFDFVPIVGNLTIRTRVAIVMNGAAWAPATNVLAPTNDLDMMYFESLQAPEGALALPTVDSGAHGLFHREFNLRGRRRLQTSDATPWFVVDNIGAAGISCAFYVRLLLRLP